MSSSGTDRTESMEAEAHLPESKDIDLPEEKGRDLGGLSKAAMFAILAGAMIFLLLGFIRYFWVKQYGG